MQQLATTGPGSAKVADQTAGSERGVDTKTVFRRAFAAAVAAVHPDRVLPPALPPPPLGRVVLLSTGKAGGSLMAAAARHYRETLGLPADRVVGLGTARHGYEGASSLIPVLSAGHPRPDEGSLRAAERVLALARTVTAEDRAVVLLSGGGSANWVAPADGVTLADKRAITGLLLASGAPIGAINTVRKHLSRIKGGRLAQALAGAGALHSFALSDVPGDDPSVIASGPTVPDPTTLGDASRVLAAYGIPPAAAIVAALADPRNETPKPGDPCFRRAAFTILARPRDAVAAARQALEAEGYVVEDLGADLQGEARVVALDHARRALTARATGRRVALLSGGELTVTLGPLADGRGGPNQEYALALALALDGAPGIAAFAADTDGSDGGAGDPDDPAGAVLDDTTLARARAQGLDGADFLARHDSTGFFAALGDLWTPGPTLVNANDLRIILVQP